MKKSDEKRAIAIESAGIFPSPYLLRPIGKENSTICIQYLYTVLRIAREDATILAAFAFTRAAVYKITTYLSA
ncbi:hypothetical protein JJE64_05180 [Alloprevotella tannerae]|uniref:hypothetical protein n=1 Tax=Alloprevotella tannerae TaxID=76122 RepID=UPI001EDAEBFD|nr:hypothetical protein [Alloprevotella tannerae]MCG2650796.1 hypothetical protein [Alloprevotella tannerae]